MSEQPEALRLADQVLALRSHLGPWRDESDPDEQRMWDDYTAAAAELRRLHALCEEMREALERIAGLDYANAAINCCALTAVEISQAALAKWKESK